MIVQENAVGRTEAPAYLAAAAARAMAAVLALAAAATAAGICPFCGAIAAARAAGSPLYFLPVFLTAPRATRFCSFSYARRRSISSPPLAAFRARRFSCTISKSCLHSNDARRESTATNSSVTRSGTRRENAFFLRIAIGRKSYHILPVAQQISPAQPFSAFLQSI